MKKNIHLVLFLFVNLLIINSLQSQTKLKLMQYNLLYYGRNYAGCSATNNDVDDKAAYLKTIIKYVQPDIFTVNELDVSELDANHILNNALNTDGVSYYQKAQVTGSFIGNMIYYNSDKLVLKSQTYINTSPRITDVYQLYFRSDELSQSHDTAFIYCLVAHLKAGSSNNDKEDRGIAAKKIMDYLSAIDANDNYLIMGDFNLYKNTETAFQNLTNYSNSAYNFYDPINKIGDWHNNSAYKYYHSQSTHTSSGCASSGGMDDRFDFILISNPLRDGSKKIQYVNSSYKVVGQDGSFFNQSLLDSNNDDLPTAIVTALYNMSDHLPIYMELSVNQQLTAAEDLQNTNFTQLYLQNPVKENIAFELLVNQPNRFQVSVISLTGKLLKSFQIEVQPNSGYFNLDVSNLETGIYILQFTDSKMNKITRKIVKK